MTGPVIGTGLRSVCRYFIFSCQQQQETKIARKGEEGQTRDTAVSRLFLFLDDGP